MPTYYRATENGEEPSTQARVSPTFWHTFATFGFIAALTFVVAFVTYDLSSQAQLRNFVTSALPRVQTSLRPGALYAARRENLPFSFGKKQEEEVEAPPKPSLFGGPAKTTSKSKETSGSSLEEFGKITGVGAKVVTDLALHLAFNTAYFVGNTYQFLTEEEQKKLAKQTVDKQLPELLALVGGTTETIGKSASVIADTPEYKDLQKSAAEAAEQLTKGLKTENAATSEVIGKLKEIVADEKGEVLSDERKAAVLETLKAGGIKATELSLYLFYNTFQVLRNLDKVLPTAEQSIGIDTKIEELQDKVVNLAEQVKDLPSRRGIIAEKVEELKESIPTAEDLAKIDPAEISLSTRAALDSAVKKLSTVNEALAEDSELRKTLNEIGTKLKPATDAVASAAAKLPLPKKDDGSIDYSKLLADTGIITIKGLKALIEATKKAVDSVNAKTEN